MKKIVYDYEEDITYEKSVNKVRAVVINKEGKCLIVKYAGLYMLPGGGIDVETYDKNYYDRKEKRDINRITNTKFYIVYTNEDINDNNKKRMMVRYIMSLMTKINKLIAY